MQPTNASAAPNWARNVLYAAAAYNLLWGAAIIFAPLMLFRWAGMAEPRYPEIWQCVGMIVGVYGIGYGLAARDPFRHWPIVLVGLLGKVLGPIGFLDAAFRGSLPWKWGATIITNDLIWWLPFAIMLYLAFRSNTDTSRDVQAVDFSDAIRNIRSHRNASLLHISSTAPTLVVFLRHAGCTFCRETLANLQKIEHHIVRSGVNLAVVHMGTPMDGTLLMERRRLHNLHHFSDPHCVLYRAFGLERGRLSQLFSSRILKRAWGALRKGHGLGLLAGDGFRLSGAFLLVNGRIIAENRAQTAADQPNYAGLLASATSEHDRGHAKRLREIPQDAVTSHV